jgi:hypothetical protein
MEKFNDKTPINQIYPLITIIQVPHARRVPSNHENTPGFLVRVTVTKPVSFRVGRLRELLKTKNVTE